MSGVPTSRPGVGESGSWQRVMLGDGTEAILLPAGVLNRITDEHGHETCNHGDYSNCVLTGHETITTYEVVRMGDPRWWPPDSCAEVPWWRDDCIKCGETTDDGNLDTADNGPYCNACFAALPPEPEYRVTHYARDDDLQPLCGRGAEGDAMTWFRTNVSCLHCLAMFSA